MTARREIPFARPMIGPEEKEAVLRVLDGHILTHGPEGKHFEEEFRLFTASDATCLSLSSCMAALHLCAIAGELGPDDEVLVSALTHVATAHAVEWVGARPVFVDCETETGNIAIDRLEEAITPKTKAIFLVHFAGIPCDMEAVIKIADKHGLFVVEDCALAVGARWNGKHVGTWGSAGCFSFYPVKHFTTAEGGMLITTRDDWAEKVSRLRAFGVDRTHTERKIPGQYDVPWLGLNYRMSEVQAAIGVAQIAKVPGFLKVRDDNFAQWAEALASVTSVKLLRSQEPHATSAPYCAVVMLDESLRDSRDDILKRLNENGIGTSVYYPQPVPRMTYYREKYGYDAARFAHSEAVSDGSIALPVGPHLGPDEMKYLTEGFVSVIEEVR